MFLDGRKHYPIKYNIMGSIAHEVLGNTTEISVDQTQLRIHKRKQTIKECIHRQSQGSIESNLAIPTVIIA